MNRIVPEKSNPNNQLPSWVKPEELIQAGQTSQPNQITKEASVDQIVASYACSSCGKIVNASSDIIKSQMTTQKYAGKSTFDFSCPKCSGILSPYKTVGQVSSIDNAYASQVEVKRDLEKESSTYNTYVDRHLVYKAIDSLQNYAHKMGMFGARVRYLNSEHTKQAGQAYPMLNNINCEIEWMYGRNQKAKVEASIEIDQAGKYKFPRVFKFGSVEYPFEKESVQKMQKEVRFDQLGTPPQKSSTPTFKKPDVSRFRQASLKKKAEEDFVTEGTNSNGTSFRKNKKGQFHSLYSPAIEYTNGDKVWLQNGNIHRLDGPAIENSDGYKAWIYEDKQYGDTKNGYSQEQFEKDLKFENEEYKNQYSTDSTNQYSEDSTDSTNQYSEDSKASIYERTKGRIIVELNGNYWTMLSSSTAADKWVRESYGSIEEFTNETGIDIYDYVGKWFDTEFGSPNKEELSLINECLNRGKKSSLNKQAEEDYEVSPGFYEDDEGYVKFTTREGFQEWLDSSGFETEETLKENTGFGYDDLRNGWFIVQHNRIYDKESSLRKKAYTNNAVPVQRDITQFTQGQKVDALGKPYNIKTVTPGQGVTLSDPQTGQETVMSEENAKYLQPTAAMQAVNDIVYGIKKKADGKDFVREFTDPFGNIARENDRGQFHSLSGPAVESTSGNKSWWVNGKFYGNSEEGYTQEQFERDIAKKRRSVTTKDDYEVSPGFYEDDEGYVKFTTREGFQEWLDASGFETEETLKEDTGFGYDDLRNGWFIVQHNRIYDKNSSLKKKADQRDYNKIQSLVDSNLDSKVTKYGPSIRIKSLETAFENSGLFYPGMTDEEYASAMFNFIYTDSSGKLNPEIINELHKPRSDYRERSEEETNKYRNELGDYLDSIRRSSLKKKADGEIIVTASIGIVPDHETGVKLEDLAEYSNDIPDNIKNKYLKEFNRCFSSLTSKYGSYEIQKIFIADVGDYGDIDEPVSGIGFNVKITTTNEILDKLGLGPGGDYEGDFKEWFVDDLVEDLTEISNYIFVKCYSNFTQSSLKKKAETTLKKRANDFNTVKKKLFNIFKDAFGVDEFPEDLWQSLRNATTIEDLYRIAEGEGIDLDDSHWNGWETFSSLKKKADIGFSPQKPQKDETGHDKYHGVPFSEDRDINIGVDEFPVDEKKETSSGHPSDPSKQKGYRIPFKEMDENQVKNRERFDNQDLLHLRSTPVRELDIYKKELEKEAVLNLVGLRKKADDDLEDYEQDVTYKDYKKAPPGFPEPPTIEKSQGGVSEMITKFKNLQEDIKTLQASIDEKKKPFLEEQKKFQERMNTSLSPLTEDLKSQQNLLQKYFGRLWKRLDDAKDKIVWYENSIIGNWEQSKVEAKPASLAEILKKAEEVEPELVQSIEKIKALIENERTNNIISKVLVEYPVSKVQEPKLKASMDEEFASWFDEATDALDSLEDVLLNM